MSIDVSYHAAHEPYIGAVADALDEAGIPVGDYHADAADPRDGAIQLATTDATRSTVGEGEWWLTWDEERGWSQGVDQDGRGRIDMLVDADLGVLPEPSVVVEWVRGRLAGQSAPIATSARYRTFEDHTDRFEALLRAYAEDAAS